MEFAVTLVLIIGGSLVAELWVCRLRVKRDLSRQGWRLVSVQWKLRRPIDRRRRLRIVAEREHDGRVGAGTATVGGWLTGPLYSSEVEYEWDDSDGVDPS